MEKKILFSSVTVGQLKKVASIKEYADVDKFKDWFSFDYELSESESIFLSELIDKYETYLRFYSEEELKAKFIIPILNKIDFYFGIHKDWYERSISAVINGCQIGGMVDYMVADGFKEPESPYFFIQEFSPSLSRSNPHDQLLAELMVALHLNNSHEIKGAYIIGQLWTFAILKKDSEGAYHYWISPAFSAGKLEDLKAIYCYLQAVKESLPNGK
ncbi:MAG: hypothetical protein AAF806_25035 [Bacteroidota bacterium]